MDKIKDLYSAEAQEKLKKIKFFCLDIDGVLTDATMFWLESQGWTRRFNVQDGYGLILLMRGGLKVGLISAGATNDVKERAKTLGIEEAHFGIKDKLSCMEEILKKDGLQFEEVFYMGDEVMDVEVLRRVGFSAAPPHAVNAVKKHVHYVTERPGGQGAVREIAEALRISQKIGPYID